MEISNEIKVKIFAQYLGQMVELDNGGSKVRNRKLIAVGGIDDAEYVKLRMGLASKNQFMHTVLLTTETPKLVLKHYLSITAEDAIEVQKIMGSKNPQKSKFLMEMIDAVSRETAIEIYQFLQYKGYDMPQYLLGGKTLFEAGLAVYE